MDTCKAERESSSSQASGEDRISHDREAPSGGACAGNTEEYPETSGAEEMKSAVIYEKSRTGDRCYSPDLPGCIAAASTLADTQVLMAEAIESHLALMREYGDAIPEPTTVVGYADVA